MCEAVRNYGDEKRQQGMQQGIQQGMQQGMEKGQEQERLNMIRQAVKMGMDTETIAKLMSLPVEQVQKLIDSLT